MHTLGIELSFIYSILLYLFVPVSLNKYILNLYLLTIGNLRLLFWNLILIKKRPHCECRLPGLHQKLNPLSSRDWSLDRNWLTFSTSKKSLSSTCVALMSLMSVVMEKIALISLRWLRWTTREWIDIMKLKIKLAITRSCYIYLVTMKTNLRG